MKVVQTHEVCETPAPLNVGSEL